jgi:hypothetical protein
MSVGVNYRIRPSATLYLTVNNFSSQGPETYTFFPDRLRQDIRQSLSFSLGVNGQF